MMDGMEIIGNDTELSGEEVVLDLLERVAVALRANCYLRKTDAYRAYSAKVVVEVQLDDLDPQSAKMQLEIGNHDPARPSRRIVVEADQVTPQEARGHSGQEVQTLERMVDGDAPETTTRERYYAPRQPKQKPA